MPDLVIDPETYRTIKPKELDPKILSNQILYLSKNKKLRKNMEYNCIVILKKNLL